MRKSRFTEAQIVAVLHEGAAGAAVKELVRRHGISEQMYYRCTQQYGGLQISATKRLKALDEENHRLKRIVADQAALRAPEPVGVERCRRKKLVTAEARACARGGPSWRICGDAPRRPRAASQAAADPPETLTANCGVGWRLTASQERSV